MKYRYLFAILNIVTFIQTVSAQKNKVELGLGRYDFPVELEDWNNRLIKKASVSYFRKINPKLEIFASYNQFRVSLGILFNWKNRNNGMPYQDRFIYFENELKGSSIGKIITRYNGKAFDIGIKYRIYSFSHHHFACVFGLSAITSLDEYLTNYVEFKDIGYRHWDMISKRQWYFGVLPGIRYDYSLWNDRINIGANFNTRFYNKNFPFQLNYGIHLGYTF